MRFLLYVLAALGLFAVVYRLLRASFRLLTRGIDTVVAGELHDLRAQKGDLTGMADAARRRSEAQRRRLLAMAAVSVWVVLLVTPPLTPWPELLYALYSALWLLPAELPRR